MTKYSIISQVENLQAYYSTRVIAFVMTHFLTKLPSMGFPFKLL
jgi:hypothetical protein